jgi:hypothetical protein
LSYYVTIFPLCVRRGILEGEVRKLSNLSSPSLHAEKGIELAPGSNRGDEVSSVVGCASLHPPLYLGYLIS